MWGVGRAYSPLASYYRVPVLVLVGAVQERPVVVAGRIVARPMLTLTATFDHRYVDGFHAAAFGHAAVEYCKNPGAFEPPFAKGTRSPLTTTAPTPLVAARRTASHA
jgi:hypothetical protein